MGTTKRSPAVQKAVATHNTQLRTKPEPVRSHAKEARLAYLKVQVVDMSETDWPRIVETLEAGKTYTVVLTYQEQYFAENKHSLNVPTMDAFTLFLYYENNIGTTCSIHPARAKFDYEYPFAEEKSCTFTLPDDFPSCKLKMKLQVKKQGSLYPVLESEYIVPVQGQAPSPEQEVFSVRRINEHLPEKTALLLVKDGETENQKLLLRGWTRQGLELDISMHMGENIISLEEMLQHFRERSRRAAPDSSSILNRFKRFSRTSPPKMLRWFNNLYTIHQHDLNLIIVDLTQSEIPWEMLEFQPRQYIGACLNVARWLKAQYFTETTKFSIEPNQHIGSVVSYLDTPGLGDGDTQDEVMVLQQVVNEPYQTINALEKRMRWSLDKIGMIYIGSHGTAGQRLQQHNPDLLDRHLESYSSRRNPELLSINLENLYKSQLPRLTVFINACESARIIKNTPTDNSNFVEEFLAHCAENYIGTLAKVDSKIASSIAKRIIAAAAEPGGANVAEVLRMLRAEAAEKVKNAYLLADDAEKPFDDFMHTFMYVYYGNPLARLQLHRRKESSEE